MPACLYAGESVLFGTRSCCKIRLLGDTYVHTMPVGNAAAVAVEFPFLACEDLPVRKAGKKFPAFPGIVVPVGIRGNRDIGFLDENVGDYGAAGPFPARFPPGQRRSPENRSGQKRRRRVPPRSPLPEGAWAGPDRSSEALRRPGRWGGSPSNIPRCGIVLRRALHSRVSG